MTTMEHCDNNHHDNDDNSTRNNIHRGVPIHKNNRINSTYQPQQEPTFCTKSTRMQCLVLGAAGAGKTSILRRFFFNNFEEHSRVPTLGSDFYIGIIPTQNDADDHDGDDDDDDDDDRHHCLEEDMDETASMSTAAAAAATATAALPFTQPASNSNSNRHSNSSNRHSNSSNRHSNSNSNSNNNNNNNNNTLVRLCMWDTPGRERAYLHKRKYSQVALSDSFFKTADAVMLVYDMTSSTSFTQLLRWYADLIEIQKEINFPILIVGNKLDLFLADQQRATTMVHPRRVPQRTVMGIPTNFRGHDFRYEYKVSPPIQPGNHKPRLRSKESNRIHADGTHTATSNAGGSGTNHNSNSNNNNNNPEVSMETSFLANRENWTSDYSYLDSLLNSEDGSRPDRDMVLLWCRRNGLEHMEVSAATGQGIREAMDSVIRLAMKSRAADHHRHHSTHESPVTTTTTSTRPFRHEQELDLEQRYAPAADEKCCFCLRPIFKWTK